MVPPSPSLTMPRYLPYQAPESFSILRFEQSSADSALIRPEPRHINAIHDSRLAPQSDIEIPAAVGEDPRKYILAIAEMLPRGVGVAGVSLLPHHHLEQSLGMGHRQRF